MKTAEEHLKDFFKLYSDQEYSVQELRKIFGVSQKEKSHLKQALKELVRKGDVKWLNTKKYIWADPTTGQAAGKYIQEKAKETSAKEPNFYTKYQEEKIKKAEAQEKKHKEIYEPETELSPDKKAKPSTQLRGRIISHEKLWKIQQTGIEEKLYFLPQDIAPFKENDRVLFKLVSADHAEVIAGIETEFSFEDVRERFLKDNKLKPYFSSQIKDQVAAITLDVDSEPNRVDYRDLHTVCIDPFGARDHDDAISLEKKGTGWQLGVHIADVSHYVTEGSPIDEEAVFRAFTQYLPWQAVHMLPEELSSDMCSLKVGQDRLAFSCMIDLSSSGVVQGYEFGKSIIRVDEFHTYEEAMEIAEAHPRHALSRLRKVTRLLNERRMKHGILLLDLPETKVKFDELNEPMGLEVKPHIESMNWIEECMLAANQCCANFLKTNEVPGVYREHGYPKEDDVTELALAEPDLFKGAGPIESYFSKKADQESNIHAGLFELFQILVNNAKGDLNRTRKVLRAMQKADYKTEGKGHFALCWQDYAHFTSPIRRYADLLVHRQMSAKLNKTKLPHTEDECVAIADKISARELEVMKIERRGVKFCGAWMAQDYLGEELDGKVSGMQDFGLFVEIPGMGFEGLVKYNSMPGDYYVYNEEKGFVYGRRSNRRIYVGDDIRIQVSKVNVLKGEVDFNCVSLGGDALTDEKVKRKDRDVAVDRSGRGSKDRGGRSDRNDRGGRSDRSNRFDKNSRSNRDEHFDRKDRGDRTEYGKYPYGESRPQRKDFVENRGRSDRLEKSSNDNRGSSLYGSGGGRKTFSSEKPRATGEREDSFHKYRRDEKESKDSKRTYKRDNDSTSRDKKAKAPRSTRSAESAISIVLNEEAGNSPYVKKFRNDNPESREKKSDSWSNKERSANFDETGVKLTGWEKIKKISGTKSARKKPNQED